MSAEQAISTLVKSYASSGIHEQVKLRISELCEKVGKHTYVLLLLLVKERKKRKTSRGEQSE